MLKKKEIRYRSTNGNSPEVTFREALLQGLAPDGGLYLPDSIPQLDENDLNSLKKLDYPGVAAEITGRYLLSEVSPEMLRKICVDAYDFPVPLEKVHDRRYIMRLDHGPTASFKDFAARMMSRLMNHFLSEEQKRLTILTATSGDTGSAVASAFYGLENITVIILFPAGEVSPMQRKQMTTLRKNITVIAVNGKFDDCQALVKKAFLDPGLSHIPLSSANSINIGRLLPQSVYYFYAWSRLASGINDKAVFSVPSGNFGNLTAGLIAHRMGLPAEKFIAATNANNEVPEFLKTGSYSPLIPSLNCISSAMNVGHPSNLARIISMYGGIMNEKGKITSEPDIGRMRRELFSVSVSDEETRMIIEDAYKRSGIILEPHGAVAWHGLNEYLMKEFGRNKLLISLETAHPAKFPEELRATLGEDPPLPLSLATLNDKKEDYLTINNNYASLAEIIKGGVK